MATTRTALGNYQLGAFYNKWMEDWRDVQDPEGNVPYTAPTALAGVDHPGVVSALPCLGSFIVSMEMYVFFRKVFPPFSAGFLL